MDRDAATQAYRRGDLPGALALQREVVARARQEQSLTARDLLLHAFLLHAANEPGQALETLRQGTTLFPQDPSLYENLGVLLSVSSDDAGAVMAYEKALALGSTSLNVPDGLCSALRKIGRVEEALQYGRRSLEAKDRYFTGASAPLPLPRTPPPPFDPATPARNVIAYSLWGDNPRYIAPLSENLRIAQHLFPGWRLRIYVDESVPSAVRAQFAAGGAQVVVRQPPADQPLARRLLWRFEVAADPGVTRFLVRDADSLLTVKERCAVDDWLRSDKHFHLMRDFYTHTDLILAGLWGGVGGILPSPDKLLAAFRPWRLENTHIDQDLLSATAWPTVRQSCLIHDSVFTGCLGSIPFPPYGTLPPGHHVGQNAFIHFRRDASPEGQRG